MKTEVVYSLWFIFSLSLLLIAEPTLADSIIPDKSDPSKFMRDIFETIVKPFGVVIGGLGVAIAAFQFFTRGAIPAIFAFLGGLLMGGLVYNAMTISEAIVK